MDILTYALAKSYTDKALLGVGTIKGAPCTVKSQTEDDEYVYVTLGWENSFGTSEETVVKIKKGADGAPGEPGPAGDPGPQGISITKIEKIKTEDLIDTYQISFSDNTTFEYTISNGSTDYLNITNKPSIEGVELIGNKTFEDLNIASADALNATDENLQNLSNIIGDRTSLPAPTDTIVNNITSVDAKVDAIIDDNETGLAKTFSSDKITKTFATLEEANKRIPQYDILPAPTEAFGGKVVQFIGTTTEDYIHNYFYECTQVENNYKWVNVAVQNVPTKVSELTNDSNFVTETELNAKGYLTEHQDLSAYATKEEIPTVPSKVSELTNDSNYQTAEQVNSTVTTEIAKIVADAPEDLNTLKEMSDWIAGHEDDASAMNSAISDNKTAITALQTGKADKSEIPTTVVELTDSADYAKKTDLHSHENKTVLDGITSTKISNWDSAKTHADSEHAPSTAQENVIETVKVNGTALTPSNKAVNVTVPTTVAELTDSDDYAKKTDLHSHENKTVLDGITSDKVTAWDNKSDFSGNYLDLNNKPTIPKGDGTTITMDEDGTLHGVKVTVDDTLSSTSTNPVQNKVVTSNLTNLKYGEVAGGKNLFNGKYIKELILIGTDYTNRNLYDEFSSVNDITGLEYVMFGGYFRKGKYTLSYSNDVWLSFNRVAIAGTACIALQDQIRKTYTWEQTQDGYTYFSIEADDSETGTTDVPFSITPNIQIEKGTQATEYEPYIPSVKILAEENAQQSTEAMDIKMLGWTVPSECPIQNEVNGNKFIQKVGRIDLGTLTWLKYATVSGVFMTSYSDLKINGYIYADGFVYYTPSWDESSPNKCIAIHPSLTNIYIKDTNYTDVESFKNSVIGKYAYYELATPITMTIDGNEAVAQLKNDIGNFTGDIDAKTVNGHTVESNVPADAKFTDTVYDDTSIQNKLTTHTHDDRYYTETEVNNLLNGKANSSHSHGAYELPIGSIFLSSRKVAPSYGNWEYLGTIQNLFSDLPLIQAIGEGYVYNRTS